MNKILITGAGRSSGALINYLLDMAAGGQLEITVADVTEELAGSKTRGHPNARSIAFDVNNKEQRESEVKNADIVISLLPPHLHQLLARECLSEGKHFLTASYLTDEMSSLNKEAVNRGILMLNECGLDPGIDHMSAVECITRLRNEGAEINSFLSYTGGLVAPESNNNPWGYKFSWNPRNVILAGKGTAARYIYDGKYKYIPYNRLFTDIQKIDVKGLGRFDGYANRDSLAYREYYRLENIPTLLRGTLRYEGYCMAWDVFVKLGLTDDSFVIENSEQMTYEEVVRSLLPSKYDFRGIEEAVADYCRLPVDGESMSRVIWTGILGEEKTECRNATPAMILQKILEEKWKLEEHDHDMIVMQHQFGYSKDNQNYLLTSDLIVKGDDNTHTAMAKTVGLPLAIVAKNLLGGKIRLTGVHIPISEEIYRPVLAELKTLGIEFSEITQKVS